MKKLLKETDEWLRHNIRAIYWKQWKKVRTRYRKLKELGNGGRVSPMARCYETGDLEL